MFDYAGLSKSGYILDDTGRSFLSFQSLLASVTFLGAVLVSEGVLFHSVREAVSLGIRLLVFTHGREYVLDLV